MCFGLGLCFGLGCIFLDSGPTGYGWLWSAPQWNVEPFLHRQHQFGLNVRLYCDVLHDDHEDKVVENSTQGCSEKKYDDTMYFLFKTSPSSKSSSSSTLSKVSVSFVIVVCFKSCASVYLQKQKNIFIISSSRNNSILLIISKITSILILTCVDDNSSSYNGMWSLQQGLLIDDDHNHMQYLSS